MQSDVGGVRGTLSIRCPTSLTNPLCILLQFLPFWAFDVSVPVLYICVPERYSLRGSVARIHP